MHEPGLAHQQPPRSANLANQINEEKALFKTFLNSDPDFSGEPIAAWRSLTGTGFEPPDVICDSVDGKRIGVEICQWAHEGAMKNGCLADKIDNNILKAIGTQPTSKPQHFWQVVFYAKTKSHLSASEHATFRQAFFDLIAYIDREWPTLKHRGRPYQFHDLKRFKPLHKHLAKVAFCPPDDALYAPYRDKDSRGGCLVVKISVEFQRDQSIHPPANGSCSSEGTKIRNGEEKPFARTSS